MSVEANDPRPPSENPVPDETAIEALRDRAVLAFDRGEWAMAARLFDEVERRATDEKASGRKERSPVRGFRYYRATARLRAEIADVPREQRLAAIAARARLVQPGNFNPEDIAGLPDVLDLLADDPAMAPFLDRPAVAAAMASFTARAAKIDGKLVTAGGAPRFRPAVLLAVRDALKRLPEAPPITSISPAHWLVISYILLLGRDPAFAHWARSQALRSALDERIPLASRAALRFRASALAETGDVEGFDRFVAAHPEAEPDLGFIRVYLGRERPAPGEKVPGTEEIADYVRGRSIAMVGPVDTGLTHGEEIDGFDIVVRMNYRGLDGFPPAAFGTRTDISYYVNGLLSKDYERTVAVLDDLRFAVVPRGRGFEGLKRVRLQGNIMAGRREAPYFAGTPNAFQRYLFDLFHYGASRIKIFNGNMWPDRNPTNPAYHKGHFASFNLPFVFIRHDIVSNFIFLKRMVERGYIEVDAVLGEILAMDVEDYVREMIATHAPEPQSQVA